MDYDVVIIGAGPAGLACAIRLGQLNQQHNLGLRVCVIEKAAQIGGHILSGALLEPRALNELLPDWQTRNPPPHTPVTQDYFYYLSPQKAWRLPTPPSMHNSGNFIISLGQFCRWMAEQAEGLNIEIYNGFAASEVHYSNTGTVDGIVTGAMGLDKQGKQTARYQPGMLLRAKHTIFAEGCRGSLTETVIERFNLRRDALPQTYALGLKELWEIDPAAHRKGEVLHSVGWPLDNSTYGGSFLYHLDNNKVSLGFAVGLDYKNPYLDPYQELQHFKTHPAISKLLLNGKRLAYGARAINEGGLQAIPKLTVPGGLLIGCAAGFLNVPKIKGIHTAMKSGMIAAEAIAQAREGGAAELTDYETQLKKSWVWAELQQARNIHPAFRWGLRAGLVYAGIDSYLLRGKAPWTLRQRKADHTRLHAAAHCKAPRYPKPDGKLTFDKLSSVYLSNTHHEENQPCHLVLTHPNTALQVNLATYAAPETRYCPAGVYEIVDSGGTQRLQINAANCLHCKACDIKDPQQNIKWRVPQGGDGPNYEDM